MITRADLGQLLSTGPTSVETERGVRPSPRELVSNGIKLLLDENAYLGEGLFGVVLQGKTESGERVAVKLFIPQTGPDITPDTITQMKANFWKETELLPTKEPTHHLPRLITKVAFSTEKGSLEGFARELLVKKAEDAIEPDDVQTTVRLTNDVADAIEFIYAQKKLIVFDIAPDNIMTRAGGDFALSDLNLASDGKGRSGDYTDGYVAPEVANLSSKGFDLKAATYSLAMTVFKLLGGFVDTDDPMANIFGQKITKPKEMDENIFEVLKEATDPNPTKRPSPKKLAEALRDATPRSAKL